MPAEQLDPLSPRLQSVVEELQGLIRCVDPTATFQVVPGDDPAGTYVIATVDVEDTETVIDMYKQIPENLSRKGCAPIIGELHGVTWDCSIFVVVSCGDPPYADPQTALSR